MNVPDKYAPIKREFLRANNAPNMTKTLRKGRSQLKTTTPRLGRRKLNLFKEYRSFCSRLYKKERKIYYDALDRNSITDKKTILAFIIFSSFKIGYNKSKPQFKPRESLYSEYNHS